MLKLTPTSKSLVLSTNTMKNRSGERHSFAVSLDAVTNIGFAAFGLLAWTMSCRVHLEMCDSTFVTSFKYGISYNPTGNNETNHRQPFNSRISALGEQLLISNISWTRGLSFQDLQPPAPSQQLPTLTRSQLRIEFACKCPFLGLISKVST
jgi:hypothetical protein